MATGSSHGELPKQLDGSTSATPSLTAAQQTERPSPADFSPTPLTDPLPPRSVSSSLKITFKSLGLAPATLAASQQALPDALMGVVPSQGVAAAEDSGARAANGEGRTEEEPVPAPGGAIAHSVAESRETSVDELFEVTSSSRSSSSSPKLLISQVFHFPPPQSNQPASLSPSTSSDPSSSFASASDTTDGPSSAAPSFALAPAQQASAQPLATSDRAQLQLPKHAFSVEEPAAIEVQPSPLATPSLPSSNAIASTSSLPLQLTPTVAPAVTPNSFFTSFPPVPLPDSFIRTRLGDYSEVVNVDPEDYGYSATAKELAAEKAEAEAKRKGKGKAKANDGKPLPVGFGKLKMREKGAGGRVDALRKSGYGNGKRSATATSDEYDSDDGRMAVPKKVDGRRNNGGKWIDGVRVKSKAAIQREKDNADRAARKKGGSGRYDDDGESHKDKMARARAGKKSKGPKSNVRFKHAMNTDFLFDTPLPDRGDRLDTNRAPTSPNFFDLLSRPPAYRATPSEYERILKSNPGRIQSFDVAEEVNTLVQMEVDDKPVEVDTKVVEEDQLVEEQDKLVEKKAELVEEENKLVEEKDQFVEMDKPVVKEARPVEEEDKAAEEGYKPVQIDKPEPAAQADKPETTRARPIRASASRAVFFDMEEDDSDEDEMSRLRDPSVELSEPEMVMPSKKRGRPAEDEGTKAGKKRATNFYAPSEDGMESVELAPPAPPAQQLGGIASPAISNSNSANRLDRFDSPVSSSTEEGFTIQLGSCLSKHARSQQQCFQCMGRQHIRLCAFQQMRYLPLNSRLAPAFFPIESENSIPDFVHKTFNEPLTTAHADAIKTAVAPRLIEILKDEIAHAKIPETYKVTLALERTAPTCTTCLHAIFSSSWMCTRCGRESCTACRKELLRLEDIEEAYRKKRAAGGKPERLYSMSDDQKRRKKCCQPKGDVIAKVAVGAPLMKGGHLASNFIPLTRICVEDLENLLVSVTEWHAAHPVAPLTTPTTASPYHFTPDPTSRLSRAPSRPFLHVSLHDLQADDQLFRSLWTRGEVMVVDIRSDNLALFQPWTPSYFAEKFGEQPCELLDNWTQESEASTVGAFFGQFGTPKAEGSSFQILDFLASDTLSIEIPELARQFFDVLPGGALARPNGVLNLAAHAPKNTLGPMVGPRASFTWGGDEVKGCHGSMMLHSEAADVVNLMVWADPDDGRAAWDIFRAEDVDELRDYVQSVLYRRTKTKQRLQDWLKTQDDPFLLNAIYVDIPMRARLLEEKGIAPLRIWQRPGQLVFVPAGCPYQVCAYEDTINVASDFVSLETLDRSLAINDLYRRQINHKPLQKADVLRLDNQVYFGWHSADRIHASASREPQPSFARTAGPASSAGGIPLGGVGPATPAQEARLEAQRVLEETRRKAQDGLALRLERRAADALKAKEDAARGSAPSL